MRKRILYFDMQKIERNDEPLCESEQEVLRKAGFNPKRDLFLRLDLEAALENLTPSQRKAVELISSGHTEKEAAAVMRISQQAVHKLVAKARSVLRERLK